MNTTTEIAVQSHEMPVEAAERTVQPLAGRA